VEVKIGVQHTPREISFDSAQSPADIEKAVADALAKDDGLLKLTDDKGRRIIVPGAKIAYVEIAEAEIRRVGFAAGS
jgi:uncharacterized protein DUF3107